MRTYLVIPEGTPIVKVMASTPHFAASKAQRGKGEHITIKGPAVLPESSTIDVADTTKGPIVDPEQQHWVPATAGWLEGGSVGQRA